MTISDLIAVKGQIRMISDAAYCQKMFSDLSGEMLQRIRRACLCAIDDSLGRGSREKINVTLTDDQIVLWMQESIEAVKCHDRPELLKKAQEVCEMHFGGIKHIVITSEEIEKGSFPRDDRLAERIRRAQAKATLKLDEKLGTKSVSIPADQQSISCFRYALLQAGIESSRPISEKALSVILLEKFESVSVGQEGDLVLFLNQGAMTHLGICRSGMILSKEGNYAVVASLRPLEDLAPEYGNQILYFRRK